MGKTFEKGMHNINKVKNTNTQLNLGRNYREQVRQ